MSPDPAIRFEGVTRRHGEVTAVEGLSLTVERGELFGIIGPDGAGKTTALRMALGILRPDAGSVLTCGLDPWRARRRLASRVGYLSQRFSLYGDLSVDENLAFFAAIHGAPGWRRRRDDLLDLVRLAPFRRRLADRLSGGMKQKLALACTLIHTPEILVLDEPTTGVDPVSRRDFWRLLGRLQRQGLTLLITTPYLDEAERCHRVALLDRGRVLALDAPRALRASRPGVTAEILARPRRDAAVWLRGRPDISEVETYGERLHAFLPAASPAQADEEVARLGSALAAAGFAVELLRPIEPSLEDIFIARLRAHASAAPEVAP